MNVVDTKHERYGISHVPGDRYWGIGIENENYIECMNGVQHTADLLMQQTRDRYCVNYWLQYKNDILQKAIKDWMSGLPEGSATPLTFPQLLNAHTITKCDRMGEHQTTYAKNPTPNPNFGGTTLWEDIQRIRPDVFGSTGHEIWWTFDGDTVEIMTQDYYCAKAEKVVRELKERKQEWMSAFIEAISKLPTKHPVLQQPIDWMRRNYGFAVFQTNPKNIAIFNNGTYHINLTAPTVLDKNGDIAHWGHFVRIHQKAARLFQWISPFFLVRYGAADPFANMDHVPSTIRACFPAGSQRLAASRYVSIGTYDTRIMERGKVLTKPISEFTPPPWWQTLYDDPTFAYNKMDSIGFDINFNKYKNHGLEFRIFDWFPETYLLNTLRILIWMFDYAHECEDVRVPQESSVWNAIVHRCVLHGADAYLTQREWREVSDVLGIPFQQRCEKDISAFDVLPILFNLWADQYGTNGPCSRWMLAKPLFRPVPIKSLQWMSETVPKERMDRQDIVRITLRKSIRFRAYTKKKSMNRIDSFCKKSNVNHRLNYLLTVATKIRFLLFR